MSKYDASLSHPSFGFNRKQEFETVAQAFDDLSSVEGVIHNHDVARAQLNNELDKSA